MITNVYLTVDFITDPSNPTPNTWWFYSIVGVLAIAYFGFLFSIIRSDLYSFVYWITGEANSKKLVQEPRESDQIGTATSPIVISNRSMEYNGETHDPPRSGANGTPANPPRAS